MTMTNEEICREYRQAKTPLKQIRILADLNGCTKREIVSIRFGAGAAWAFGLEAAGIAALWKSGWIRWRG